MNNETLELARRAVACEGWSLMRGMILTNDKLRVLLTHQLFHDGDENLPTGYWESEPIDGQHPLPRSPKLIDENGDFLPDLSDPATLGCLLHLVREAWAVRGYVDVFVESWSLPSDDGAPKPLRYSAFAIRPSDGYARLRRHIAYGSEIKSRAAALVAALEAAGGG